MNSTTTYLLIALSLTLGACSGTASLIGADTTGGKVRLEGSYMDAMADARLSMAEHCGGRFDVMEEAGELSFRCHSADLAAHKRPAVPALQDATAADHSDYVDPWTEPSTPQVLSPEGPTDWHEEATATR